MTRLPVGTLDVRISVWRFWGSLLHFGLGVHKVWDWCTWKFPKEGGLEFVSFGLRLCIRKGLRAGPGRCRGRARVGRRLRAGRRFRVCMN